MSKPYFTPWKRSKFNGTLILAESCDRGSETEGVTGWRICPDVEWPHNFIIRHVEAKREQDDDTFKALRESFLYNGKVMEPFEFWEHHAFTNLIPRLVDGDAGKPEDWVGARTEFPLIREAVQPKRILIAGKLGVKMLRDLSDTYVTFDDGCEMSFKGIPAVGIYHPAYWNRSKPKYTLNQARRATDRLRDGA